ncbi:MULTISPECIES: C40 family peptidase [Kitasatospora]|uniref:Putative peptidase C40 family protein n=1 Tax=Kitasatospora setae (strain ATCC 33774 / DSM 43861 / JCM 3304 / KCC A-0304 / NBRC 14216 / KM-6054) TaxID=452652 RepID=E4NDN6_KITSK|nr:MULTISPECIES: C40 family peptidase [Kitasatospora]BAJ29317.1 putative peptidase C40 family protein [Kitasatospora setae KM-6054]
MPRRLLPALLLSTAALLALLPAANAPAAPAAPAAAPALGPAPGAALRPADDPPPDYPSADDVSRARADADAKAADAAAAQARLAADRAELDRAGQAAEQAVEAYNGALVHLARARAAAEAAAGRSAAAEAAHAEAADRAAGLLGEIYRQGASPQLSAVNALLGARGTAPLSAQAAAIGTAGARTRQILDDATATAKAAAEAADAARSAEEAARTAAGTVRTAKEQAQRRVADQQTRVAETARRQEALLAELAAARDTTVELERQRQQALDAIAAREAEEAARRAEAEAAAAAAAAAAEEAARHHAAPQQRESAWSAGGSAAALAFARSVIGLPYIWGGEGPQGYDCSGLTMMAWRLGGKNLTHFAADQYAESTPVSYAQLRPGDLVFWTKTGRAADIHHVAIYLGDDQMIEAPRPGTAIKQASLWIMGRPDFYARP